MNTQRHGDVRSNYSINPPAGGALVAESRPRPPAAGYAGRYTDQAEMD